MLQSLQKRKSEPRGFTIIEVMIVLAIAGLIMLIVLLAVPALQRNSRNTAIKNDASALAAGFSEYISNNDGTAPTTLAQSGSAIKLSGAAGTNPAEAKVSGSTKLNATAVTSAPAATNPADNLWWRTGVSCSGTTSARAIIVYYSFESSSGTAIGCVDAS